MRSRIGSALLVAACLASPATAQYSCAVTGGGSVDFLVYNPASGSPTPASTTVTLTCNHLSGGVQRIDWTMVLSNGGSGNCTARTMAGPGASLSYNIYQNNIAGGVWGNLACASYPSGQLKVGPGAGNGTASTTLTLFGRLPAGQFVTSGTYSDTLQLTINF